MRFFDTMSMHIAIHGFTSFQRVLVNAHKSGKDLDDVMAQKNPRAPRKKSEVGVFCPTFIKHHAASHATLIRQGFVCWIE